MKCLFISSKPVYLISERFVSQFIVLFLNQLQQQDFTCDQFRCIILKRSNYLQKLVSFFFFFAVRVYLRILEKSKKFSATSLILHPSLHSNFCSTSISRISLRCPIHINNPVEKPNQLVILPTNATPQFLQKLTLFILVAISIAAQSGLDVIPRHDKLFPALCQINLSQPFTSLFLNSQVERYTVRIKCLAQGHNTTTPGKAYFSTA